MKKVVMTVIGVLALAASANAQLLGTWYTDEALWTSLITNTISTANYDVGRSDSAPWEEKGVTATVTSGNWYDPYMGVLSTDNPVNFTFNGNAFGGMFKLLDPQDIPEIGILNFSVDGSSTNIQSLTSTTGYTFLGYISDSSSPISVKISPHSSGRTTVDNFSFGTGTNPAGANVAPEPGSLALALTGGCALIGMCIRRRRMSN